MTRVFSGVEFRRVSWDRIGTAASALCVIHCVVTPIIVSLAPAFAAFLPGSSMVHRVLIFFVAALGALALRSGYAKHHRYLVLILMSAGLLLIGYGAFGRLS